MVARAFAQLLGGSSLFLFEIESFADPLRVVRFSGTEGLSSLFEFKVELACENQDIDFAEVVGKPARLIIQGELAPRFLSGIVSRFEQIQELPRYAVYRATVVPLVWRLTQRYDCRIFQKLDTTSILKKVFAAAGVPADRVRFVLDGTYESRDYCVQYRESDWAFVSRLMEEDGIFYFFEHEADKHVLVIADGAPALKPMDGGEVLPFRRETKMVVEEEHVSRFRFTEEVRSGKVTLRDFKFRQPELLMEVEKQAEVDADLEVYDYPGEYQDPGSGSTAKGQTIARVRLQAWQATKRVGQGRSDCERLCPGRMFTLEEHSRGDYNARYLITSVRHHGSQPQVLDEESQGGEFSYSNRFMCIPAKVPYRPARVTPRPQVRGVQTAVVVGPPGEEIHVDEWGRVKVQFHWDRQGKKDEHSSCWVRVSQLWAGEVWGGMFIPRIGQEVLVDFIEGDPDRPIIIGRVYNAKNPTPYELPALKTRSTIKSSSSPGGEGYNELRFEDAKGQEQIFMHAERNMDVHVKNDSFESILHNRHQTIGSQGKKGKVGDQNELVYRDKSLTVHRHSQEHVGGDLKLTVGGIDGDGNMDIVVRANRKELVHKDSHLHVKQDLNEQVDGTQSLTVGKDLHLKVGQLTALESGKEVHLKSTNVVIEAASGVTIKGPGGFITIDASGIAIKGTLVQINTGGSPLSGSGVGPTEPQVAAEAQPTKPTPADRGVPKPPDRDFDQNQLKRADKAPISEGAVQLTGSENGPKPKSLQGNAATPSPGVTLEQLRAIMPRLPPDRAEQYLPYLNQAMAEANINTPQRKAAFLAQLAHESGELNHFEELASGAAYEGRRNLGNTQPGDGVRYKGRGPIQLTGRANYRDAGKALGLDLEGNPKIVSTPGVGFRTSAWYWDENKLNELADRGDFRAITRRINGGFKGLADREAYYRRALNVLRAE
jgi:type VI secretion system secreted protein VgrG